MRASLIFIWHIWWVTKLLNHRMKEKWFKNRQLVGHITDISTLYQFFCDIRQAVSVYILIKNITYVAKSIEKEDDSGKWKYVSDWTIFQKSRPRDIDRRWSKKVIAKLHFTNYLSNDFGIYRISISFFQVHIALLNNGILDLCTNNLYLLPYT